MRWRFLGVEFLDVNQESGIYYELKRWKKKLREGVSIMRKGGNYFEGRSVCYEGRSICHEVRSEY